MRRFAIGTSIVLFAVVAKAQQPPNLQSISIRPANVGVLVDAEYDSNASTFASTAMLTYQSLSAKNQAIGGPQTVNAEAASQANHLLFTIPATSGVTDMTFSLQLQPAGAKSVTIRTNVTVAVQLAKQNTVIATLQSQLADTQQEIQELHTTLNSSICAVTTAVRFGGIAATFPDRVVLYFTTPSPGRFHVHVSRPGQADFEGDSGGASLDNYVTVDGLQPGASYSAEAFVLDAQGHERPNTRITAGNHDNRLNFTTDPASTPPTFNTFTAVAANDGINVTYDLDQDTTSEVMIEQELRDSNGNVTYRAAGATKRHITPDHFGKVVPTEAANTAMPVPFEALRPNTVYRVTVKAANKYGQTTSKARGNLKTGDAIPPLDFIGTMIVNLSPLGYLLTWSSTTDPDIEPTNPVSPLAGPNAGIRISVPNHPEISAITTPAARDHRSFHAMFDKASIALIAEKAAAVHEDPVITAFMQKDGKPVYRALDISFTTPSPTAVAATALNDQQKQDLQAKATRAISTRRIPIDWSKVAKEGVKVLLAAIP